MYSEGSPPSIQNKLLDNIYWLIHWLGSPQSQDSDWSSPQRANPVQCRPFMKLALLVVGIFTNKQDRCKCPGFETDIPVIVIETFTVALLHCILPICSKLFEMNHLLGQQASQTLFIKKHIQVDKKWSYFGSRIN